MGSDLVAQGEKAIAEYTSGHQDAIDDVLRLIKCQVAQSAERIFHKFDSSQLARIKCDMADIFDQMVDDDQLKPIQDHGFSVLCAHALRLVCRILYKIHQDYRAGRDRDYFEGVVSQLQFQIQGHSDRETIQINAILVDQLLTRLEKVGETELVLVLELFFFQDYKKIDIARALGKDEASVRRAMKRGLAKLRKFLKANIQKPVNKLSGK